MRGMYGDKWFFEECKAKVVVAGRHLLAVWSATPLFGQAALKASAPPLCATFGDWVRPRDRKGPDVNRCTVLGCVFQKCAAVYLIRPVDYPVSPRCGLGHLTLPRMKEAFGPDLWRRTFTVIILRCRHYFYKDFVFWFTAFTIFLGILSICSYPSTSILHLKSGKRIRRFSLCRTRPSESRFPSWFRA